MNTEYTIESKFCKNCNKNTDNVKFTYGNVNQSIGYYCDVCKKDNSR